MEALHTHCTSCISRRCMVKPEPGTSCDLLVCPLVCGAVFHSCKIDEHRLLCPLERVPCLNYSIGCPFMLTRGKMAEHLEVCPAGVVCCTMEWNRWPVNDEDCGSYRRLSTDTDEEEQLDMALAQQDQRTMLASLKVVSLALANCSGKPHLAEMGKQPSISAGVMVPDIPVEEDLDRASVQCCSKDVISNGINGLNEEQYGELYKTTVETTKSLSAALNVLTCLNTSDTMTIPTTSGLAASPEFNLELHEMFPLEDGTGSNCDKIASGVSSLNEELQPQHHHTLMELGRTLASALGALGDAVQSSEPSYVVSRANGGTHQSDTVECSDIEMKDSSSENKVEFDKDGGIHDEKTDTLLGHVNEELCHETAVRQKDVDQQRLLNSCPKAVASTVSQDHSMELTEAKECSFNGVSSQFVDPLIPHRPEVRYDLATVVMQETFESQAPVLQLPVHAQALVVKRESVLPSIVLDIEDKTFVRKLQNLQLLRNFIPLALNGQKSCLPESLTLKKHRCMMEDKAVDTSDLEQEPQDDHLGLGEIDFTAAALLFSVEESVRARRISDTVYAFGGSSVDFGTQTFSFPPAVLATNTMVGEVASASACDRAVPRLSQPSLSQRFNLENMVPQPSWIPREGFMFTFECGQLFRREEFLSHFRNVHGDIHSGLNGWMEHRCPLAYYGCTYSQRRFFPYRQGSKIIHDRHLRSFGVQPMMDIVTESGCDRLSELPFEILQHMARFLDGFSLCQLSMVSRTMRDVCASLLQTQGMVVVQWEKKQDPEGRRSWHIKDKVWKFSTAFSPVVRWEFADISSMAEHLKRCPYNEVHRQVEAVPLPCMYTTREFTRDGRSLRSVLKPVFS